MRTMFDYAAHGLYAPRRRPSIPGPVPQTVATVLDPVLRSDPDRLALVGRSGRLTYAQLDRVVDATAAALAELGVGRFDRVAACLPNDLDVVVTMLASQRMGAIWVGINKVLAPREKAGLLQDSGARVFLAMPEGAGTLPRDMHQPRDLQHLMLVEPADAARQPFRKGRRVFRGSEERAERTVKSPPTRRPPLRTPAARRAIPKAPSTASTICYCRERCRCRQAATVAAARAWSSRSLS